MKRDNRQFNLVVWILLLGLLGLQSCQTQSDAWPYAYNDWESSNLKGSVKSVIKKAYSADTNTTNEKTDSLFGHEEKYFNSDGLLTKVILYRDKITAWGYSLFRYDAEKNQLIEQQYRLNDQKDDHIVSTLDDKEQTMVQTTQDKKGDFDYRRKYSYDTTNSVLGDAVEIKNYTGNKDQLTTTEKYRYNADGHKIEETLLDKDGIRHHYFYQYNAKDQLSQLIRHGYNDEVIDTLTYRYRNDSVGNWIERKIYNNGDLNAVVKRKITYYSRPSEGS